MRILNVNSSLDPLDGGQSERTFQMSRALAERGEIVDVVVPDKGLSTQRVEAIRPANVIALRTLSRRFFIAAATSRSLKKYVDRADLLHLMGYWSILNATIFRTARALRKPYVVCPAGSWRIFGRSRHVKRIFDRMVGRKIIDGATRLIAITDHEKQLFESYGVPADKIVVVPNAIDPREYAHADDAAFRRKFQIGKRRFILFLGRLDAIKGPDLLLDAYLQSSLASDFDLVFAGRDGGMGEDLQTRVTSAGMSDRVHFIGHIDGVDKAHALHASAFLVIPSRHEAMSIVVLEAGAAGAPVLLTDECGFDEIESVGGGFVVRPEVEAIRAGLMRMAAADRKTLGVAIHDFVLRRYTWNCIAAQYQQLYNEILTTVPRGRM